VAGRVLYQVALTVTKNDNGFVTMFFLLVPALTCLISIPLSWRIAELRFIAEPMFFSSLLAVAAPLVFFSNWKVILSNFHRGHGILSPGGKGA